MPTRFWFRSKNMVESAAFLTLVPLFVISFIRIPLVYINISIDIISMPRKTGLKLKHLFSKKKKGSN